ncbi:MAG: alpha/beta hydrolase, partial [Ruminococcus sp.]|nr:alpha/beta hydrolase [Ruminococcus sp.]
MKTKKMIAVLIAAAALLSSVACQSGTKDISNTENNSSVIDNEANSVKLKNLMSETERNRVSVGELTLLDEYVAKDDESSESKQTVKIHWQTVDELRAEVEKNKDSFGNPSYEEMITEIDKMDPDLKFCRGFVNGRQVSIITPDYNYDGREIEWYEMTFANFDEFKIYLKEYLAENFELYDDNTLDANQLYEDIITLWQSVIDGTYEEITVEEEEKIFTESYYNTPFNGSYKDIWEYERSEVEEIKDSVKEISIYDEELDTEFLIHVTLPPNFDESKTYPMFVFSDGVWRFGNVPSIRKLMENGEIQDVILVTIGYNYKFDGTSMVVRSKYFYEEREKTLDFLTNNLAPYLNELYNIDFEHSGFYGHSAGGVFSHYAVFNSDKYENQPFKYYIIGSPALWQLHHLDNEKYPDAGITDYNYWDRNDTLDKVIFLCGGENEDPDYEEDYDDYDTTLEGIANLMNRLESHGVTTAKSKIYENSGHWQFIPDMFIEFFREYYG